MIKDTTLRKEEELLGEMRKGEKLSSLMVSLLAIHKGDAAELARLLFFLLANELLGKSERCALVVVFVKLCEEYTMPGYMRAAWEIEKRTGVAIVLFYDLLVLRSHARVS